MFDQMYGLLTFGNTRHYDPVTLRPEMKAYTIFIDGISIGGSDELSIMHANGRLLEILIALGLINEGDDGDGDNIDNDRIYKKGDFIVYQHRHHSHDYQNHYRSQGKRWRNSPGNRYSEWWPAAECLPSRTDLHPELYAGKQEAAQAL